MTNPVTLNKLGCEYFAKQQWQEAANAFQQAIDLRADFLDAYYNLGLALNKMNRMEQALITWRALLDLSPDHLGAGFQVGCLLMRQEKFEEAQKQFSAILKSYPTHIETLANIATCCLQLGQLAQAKKYYLDVLQYVNEDAQTLYNLGVVCVKQGTLDEAVNYYLRAIAAEPDFFAAHNNLGAVYLALKNRDEAVRQFQEALRIQPGNEAVRHTLAILAQQKNMTTTPQSYITALFDSYADHYDAHLSQSLQYQVPAQMYDLLHHAVHLPSHQWRVLDLGCGTGLCGQYFRDTASELIGVDLSERMLQVARDKKLYDVLSREDVLSFLDDKTSLYDLIVAGDTLVYMGELSPLFAAVRRALKAEGYFVFNVEASDTEDFYLTSSGRFAHSKHYIDQLIEKHAFRVAGFRVINLRLQENHPVQGYLYLVQAER